MGNHSPAGDPALRLHPIDQVDHIMFVEVEGELCGGASHRWSGLLRGVVQRRAEGIAIDLRGCRELDEHCLGVLLAAAEAMKARGGSGVALVMLPGSELGTRLRRLAGERLPIYDSAKAALVGLGGPRMPVPATV